VVLENYRQFKCQSCDFAIWKTLAGRQFETAEVEELLVKRVLGPLQGFRSKLGRPFAALLKLNAEAKIEFDFGQNDNAANGGAEPIDFSSQEPLGKCPKCGARVFENGMSYVCEKAVGPDRACDFRSGKIILQQAVDRAQMVKLLATGKTDLLKRFISKKNRPFSAFLAVGKDGRVGFEFEPRKPKAVKSKAAKEAATKGEPTPESPKNTTDKA
jgi:DNA topoisomerase-3